MGAASRPVVLLVDDSASDRQLVEIAFDELDVECSLQTVPGGQEALQFLRNPRKPRPALLLLDLNMPGMSGMAVLEQLKADPGLRMLPVIVLTTSGADADRTQALDLGANAYVRKPVGYEDLLLALRRTQEFWLLTAER